MDSKHDLSKPGRRLYFTGSAASGFAFPFAAEIALVNLDPAVDQIVGIGRPAAGSIPPSGRGVYVREPIIAKFMDMQWM